VPFVSEFKTKPVVLQRVSSNAIVSHPYDNLIIVSYEGNSPKNFKFQFANIKLFKEKVKEAEKKNC